MKYVKKKTLRIFEGEKFEKVSKNPKKTFSRRKTTIFLSHDLLF